MPPDNNTYNVSQPVLPSNQLGPVPPASPKKHHWISIAVIALLSLVLLIALGFGYWAYSSRQDYKNNSDQKASAAVKKLTKSRKRHLMLLMKSGKSHHTKNIHHPPNLVRLKLYILRCGAVTLLSNLVIPVQL